VLIPDAFEGRLFVLLLLKCAPIEDEEDPDVVDIGVTGGPVVCLVGLLCRVNRVKYVWKVRKERKCLWSLKNNSKNLNIPCEGSNP